MGASRRGCETERPRDVGWAVVDFLDNDDSPFLQHSDKESFSACLHSVEAIGRGRRAFCWMLGWLVLVVSVLSSNTRARVKHQRRVSSLEARVISVTGTCSLSLQLMRRTASQTSW